MSGYHAAGSTDFEYGTTLPDLRPSAPWLVPGDRTPTQTLQVALFNEGQSTAPATTLALYVGTPLTGTLITTLAVPALDVGASAVFTYTWNRGGQALWNRYSTGQAGPTLISARADVNGDAAEFDETNNDSEAVAALPGLCPEDVNDDGQISVLDIQAVASGWGGSDPDLDVDEDGDVDIVDVQRVAGRWGTLPPLSNTHLPLHLAGKGFLAPLNGCLKTSITHLRASINATMEKKGG